MYVLETLKKMFEQVTSVGKRSSASMRWFIRRRKAHRAMFEDDGAIPNNSRLPFIHYRSPVRLTHAQDPAAVFEDLFESNGWRDSWRNGIYDYLHYHSTTHEVLGIARGHARVGFGGDGGKIIQLRAGDVVILPPVPVINAFQRAATSWSLVRIHPRENMTNARGQAKSTSAR